MCARQQLRSVLDVAMKTLPERYKKVVTLYYTNEMTMKEIGGVLGINESRVSQIHKSALEKMNVSLQSAGIHSSFAQQPWTTETRPRLFCIWVRG
jgi:RNA polymerase sigma factor for flagellar operon FliA